MKLRYWTEISQENQSLTPGWKCGSDGVVFVNPPFGTIVHVAVCDDTGKPIYDQPAWSEPVGAIIVAVDETQKIALVENFRTLPPAVGSSSTYPPADLSQHGRISLELPRGFPLPNESSQQAARREAEEETGCRVKEVRFLGENNANTTFFLNNISIWLAKITQQESPSYAPDPNEPIQKVCFLSVPEIMNLIQSGQIICSLTKAAILHYLACDWTE